MPLGETIKLSKKAQATFERFPAFFEPTLNALYDLHLQHGYRKPELSIYRDESTVLFKAKDHSIAIMYLLSGQLVISDSRLKGSAKYDTVRMSEEELPTSLFELLSDRMPSFIGSNSQ